MVEVGIEDSDSFVSGTDRKRSQGGVTVHPLGDIAPLGRSQHVGRAWSVDPRHLLRCRWVELLRASNHQQRSQLYRECRRKCESYPTKRLGVKRPQVVHDWRRRHDGFPEPVATLKTAMIWYWPHVEAWARETGRI